MSETIAPPHVHPAGATYAEDLDQVARIAAWVGAIRRAPTPITFGGLMVGFLFADDPCSLWFQGFLRDAADGGDAILAAAGVPPERRDECVKKAVSGELPEARTFLSDSARRMLERAQVISAAAGSRVVAARHLMGAFVLSRPESHGHAGDFERWRLDLTRWRAAFDEFLGAQVPEEARSGWAFPDGATPEWFEPAAGPAPARAAGRGKAAGGAERVSGAPGFPDQLLGATDHVRGEGSARDYVYTDAARRVIAAALGLRPSGKALTTDPEALGTDKLLFALLLAGAGLDGPEAADARFLDAQSGRTGGRETLAVQLRRYTGGAGPADLFPGPVPELDVNLPPLTAAARVALDEASRAAQEVSGTRAIAVRHLVAAVLALTGSEGSVLSYLAFQMAGLDPQAMAAAFFRQVTARWFRDDRGAWEARLLGAREALVSGFRPDLTEGHRADDRLDVTRFADALARVIAAWDVEPPLAVGVFGDWGSGKTFFMDLIRESIGAVAADRRLTPKGAPMFCEHVVPIQFNAWHYADANLWACLTDHIFQELDTWLKQRSTDEEIDALFAQLETSQQVLEEARERVARAEDDKRAADQRLRNARRALQDAMQDLGRLNARDLWREAFDAVIRDQQLGSELRAVGEVLGFDAALRSAGSLRATLEEARGTAGRARLYWASLARDEGRWPRLAGLAAATIGAPLLAAWLLGWLDSDWTGSSEVLAQVGAFVSGLGVWLQRTAATARRGLGAVQRVDQRVQTFLERANRGLREDAARLESQLVQREAAVSDAHRALQAATERHRRLEREVAEMRPTRRLARFIEERLASGDYRKRLGVVSMVRRDFLTLSNLMLSDRNARLGAAGSDRDGRAAGAQPGAGEDAGARDARVRPIDRIVLYIDDLDRCPTERVVEVLEAIHLLLALPLFVVVVGVDVRWVARSLHDRYPHHLTDSALLWRQRPGAGGDATATARTAAGKAKTGAQGKAAASRAPPRAPLDRATALDYLEKIFQIPFWLPAMGPEVSQALLMDLVEGRREAEETPPPPDRQTTAAPPGAGEATEKSGGKPPAPAAASGQAQPREQKPAPKVAATTRAQLTMDAVTIQPHERDFMIALAPYAGRSPRRLKRFVNTYRILKAACDPVERRAFVTDGGRSGEYRAAMTLLALTTGAPQLAVEVSRALLAGQDDERVSAFVERLGRIDHIADGEELERARAALETYVAHTSAEVDLELLRYWAPTVTRFTFRSGTLRA